MKEETVQNYLLYGGHIGKANAVKSKEICRSFGIAGTELREAVNTLRVQGVPICSGTTGYYMALNIIDIDKTIKQLNNRIAAMQNAIEGLKKYKSVESIQKNDTTI